MKSIKIYLIIVTCLLVTALGFGVYVWFKLQTLYSVASDIPTTEIEPATSPDTLLTPDKVSSPDVSTTSASEVLPEPVVIETDKLTDTQKNALETLGFESNTLTITPEMIACAERVLGAARMQEIINGAAPGPLESLQLLGCIE